MLCLKQGATKNIYSSSTQTASGNSALIDVGKYSTVFRTFTAMLTVTARSGTSPTLSCQWKASADGTNLYNLSTLSIGTHTGYTSGSTIPSVDLIQFDIVVPYLRFDFLIGGTSPSWTFSLDLICYQS